MLIALYTVILISAILAIGLRLFRPTLAAGQSSLAMPEIDSARYRPMERMLRNEEFTFLANQGVDRRSIRRLRAQRRGIFRMYLRALTVDFSHIAGAVRLAMLESNEARPDLAKALFRSRAVFAYAVFMINLRLAAHTVGWSSVAIDVRPLITALEIMRQQCGMTGETALSAA